jgi:hypothetical protein
MNTDSRWCDPERATTDDLDVLFNHDYLSELSRRSRRDQDELLTILRRYEDENLPSPQIKLEKVGHILIHLRDSVQLFNQLASLVSNSRVATDNSSPNGSLHDVKRAVLKAMDDAKGNLDQLFDLSGSPKRESVASDQDRGCYHKPTVEDDSEDETMVNSEQPTGTSILEEEVTPRANASAARFRQPVHSETEAVQLEPPSPSASDASSSRKRRHEDNIFNPFRSDPPSNSKRRRVKPAATMSSATVSSFPKRKRHDAEITASATKRSKSSHTITHFGEEAIFVTDVQYEDLSDEVEVVLKLKAEQQAHEKLRLQDTAKKRKLQSLNYNSFHADPVDESIELFSKRRKYQAVEETEEEL